MLKFKPKNKSKKNTIHKKAQLISDKQPFAFTESYKALRTNLKFMTMGGKHKKIVVTSAIPGEGKSTFSLNLAITLAETGMKVLLVDGDMRNPSVHRYLRLRQTDIPGLSSLLSGEELVEKSIGHLEKYNLHLILSGQIPPNPAELLGTSRLNEILKKLEVNYDYIIVDAPPVSVVTDAAEIAQACDGTILVVGQKMSTQDQVLKAKANLDKVNANILGVVLNNFDMSKANKSGSNSYSYYYGNEE